MDFHALIVLSCRLLDLLKRVGGTKAKRGSLAGKAARAHGESEAERIIRLVAKELGLPQGRESLIALRKGDPRKVICAALAKGRTSVSNDCLAHRLAMGHPAAMSQLIGRLRKDQKGMKLLTKHGKILKSKD